jgi:hypothetical protein
MNTKKYTDQLHAVDHFGRKITARLAESADVLPHDVTERLRAARVRAIDKRKWVLLQSATDVFLHARSGTATAGHGVSHATWWNKLGIAGLVLALAAGLFTINLIQEELGAQELAEIDTAILTDDLPPSAYIDPGFTQFLKLGDRLDH